MNPQHASRGPEGPDDDLHAQAAHWHLAAESDAMDWDGFTGWLEADPRHRAAYEQIALADRLAIDHREALAEPVEEEPVAVLRPRRRLLPWAGGAIAASLAAALVLPQVLAPPAQSWHTGGAAQRIALADGSSVVLGPRSSLTVEGRAQDRMALAGGALFDIRHDPDRPLRITAGGTTISDIGTRFDVQAEGGFVRVAVAEGHVEVGAEGLADPVRLAAGQALALDAGGGTAEVSKAAAQDVGAWQQGRLSYNNARLALVAADLRRYAGVSVEVPAALRDRRFSGTLIVDNGDKTLHDLAQLLGLDLAGGHGHWRLGERSRARP